MSTTELDEIGTRRVDTIRMALEHFRRTLPELGRAPGSLTDQEISELLPLLRPWMFDEDDRTEPPGPPKKPKMAAKPAPKPMAVKEEQVAGESLIHEMDGWRLLSCPSKGKGLRHCQNLWIDFEVAKRQGQALCTCGAVLPLGA